VILNIVGSLKVSSHAHDNGTQRSAKDGLCLDDALPYTLAACTAFVNEPNTKISALWRLRRPLFARTRAIERSMQTAARSGRLQAS